MSDDREAREQQQGWSHVHRPPLFATCTGLRNTCSLQMACAAVCARLVLPTGHAVCSCIGISQRCLLWRLQFDPFWCRCCVCCCHIVCHPVAVGALGCTGMPLRSEWQATWGCAAICWSTPRRSVGGTPMQCRSGPCLLGLGCYACLSGEA
jgi:hypothetical protein